jgi:hypothetical protein
MKPFPLDELRIEYLRETHDLSSFHCRNDDLNDFLKSDAKKIPRGSDKQDLSLPLA